MTTAQHEQVRQPTPISVARWVAAAQAVSLLGFAAAAIVYVVHLQSAPKVTAGFGDFSGVFTFFGVAVAIACCVAALAVGAPACSLKRYDSSARLMLLIGEYATGGAVALALLSNLHARHQLPFQLLGIGYVGLTAAALVALYQPSAAAWTANR